MKRFLFLLLFLVAFTPLAAATLEDDTIAYYKFDENTGTTAGDSAGSNDGTITGATWTTGKINSGLSFDGVNDKVAVTSATNLAFSADDDFTISFWFKSTSDSFEFLYGSSDDDNYGAGYIFGALTDTGAVRFAAEIASIGTTIDITSSTTGYNDGNWHLYTAVHKGSTGNAYLYVDGVLRGTDNDFAATGVYNSLGEWEFGTEANRNNIYYNGQLDEVALFDIALTADEISFLYASGGPTTAQQYPYVSGPVNFSVTARDSFDNASITNFSIHMTDGVQQLDFSTINGTITTTVLSNSTSLFNITVSSNQSGGYFNKFYEDVNVSNNLLADLFQFRINATDAFSGATLNNFTLTQNNTGFTTNTTTRIIRTNFNDPTGGGLYDFLVSSPSYFNRSYAQYNVSNPLIAELGQAGANFFANEKVSLAPVNDFNITINGNTRPSNETFLLSAGVYNATFSKNEYYSLTREITVQAQTIHEFNFTGVYNHILNLTLQSLGVTTTEDNFTVNIYSNEHDFVETRSTTNGTILANLIHGNYTVFLNDSIHVFTEYNLSLNDSVNFTSFVMQAFNINTLKVNFFDVNTLAVINNVNLTAESNIRTYQFTTTNGSINQDLLNPSTYKLTARSTGYEPAIVFVTLNDDNQTVNMYLDQSLTEIFINVQSTLGDTISDATITITYNINGSFVTVYQAKTDAFGQSNLFLDPNKDYFITVTHPQFTTFEGSFSGLQTSYVVSMQPSDQEKYTSLFDFAQFNTIFVYNEELERATFVYDTVSGDGAISYFSVFATYNGVTYGQNVSGSSGGGTITIVINNATPQIQDKVTFAYQLKVNGRPLYQASETYFLSEQTPSDTTIRGGLFQSPKEGMTPTGQAILGTLIVIFFVAAAIIGTGSLAAGAVAGALVVGALSIGSFALFNPTYGAITAILLLVTALGDAAL